MFVECSNGGVSATKSSIIEVQEILTGIILSTNSPVMLPDATTEITLTFGGEYWL